MRLLVATSVVVLSLMTVPASAQRSGGDGQSKVYFWEDAYSYGWSDVVDPRHTSDPPKVIKKARVSVAELCGRLVGRIMRTDQSSRIYSTQMEDYCIRNGGKI